MGFGLRLGFGWYYLGLLGWLYLVEGFASAWICFSGFTCGCLLILVGIDYLVVIMLRCVVSFDYT